MKVLFVLLAMIASAATAQAETFQVTNKAELNAALAVAQPGDEVLAVGGNYGDITFARSGAEGFPIILRGSGATARQISTRNRSDGHDYLRIIGWNIQGQPGGTIIEASGILVGQGSVGVEVIGNTIRKTRSEGVLLDFTSDPRPPSDPRNFWDYMLETQWPRDITIVGNTILDCQRGLGVFGSNVMIADNIVRRPVVYRDGPGSDNDYARFKGDNITFFRNLFEGADVPFANQTRAHIDGGQTWDRAKNVKWIDNIIVDFHQGLLLQDLARRATGNIADILVEGNIFANITGWGVGQEGAANVVYDGNIFYRGEPHFIGNRYVGSTARIIGNLFVEKFNAPAAYWASDGGRIIEARDNIVWETAKGSQSDVRLDPMFVDPLGDLSTWRTARDGFLVRNPSVGAMGWPMAGGSPTPTPTATPEPTSSPTPTPGPTPTQTPVETPLPPLPEPPTPLPEPTDTPTHGPTPTPDGDLEDRVTTLERQVRKLRDMIKSEHP